jgi:hypothetical protein
MAQNFHCIIIKKDRRMKQKKADWIKTIEKILDYINTHDFNNDGTPWEPNWNDLSQDKYYQVGA